MRIKVPVKGTVIQVEPCIVGSEDDPIRPVIENIGNGLVGWRFIGLDLEAELMEIEVFPSNHMPVSKSETRLATVVEQQGFMGYAKTQIEAVPKGVRLVNPFKAMLEVAG